MYDDEDTDTITDDEDYDDFDDDEYPHDNYDDDFDPLDLESVIEHGEYKRARRTLGDSDIPAWPFILGSGIGAAISAYVAWDRYDTKIRDQRPEDRDWKPCLIASFVCLLFVGAFIGSIRYSK